MRVLSLWQPWASAMALGLKKIETRSWDTHYRGLIAIHAAKRRIDPLDMPDVCVNTGKAIVPLCTVPHAFGAIVAVGRLATCWPTEMIPRAYPTLYTPTEAALGNYDIGRFGWIFEDLKPLREPLPFKGGQGLRELPNDVAYRVMELAA